jgi:hypothetical protein
MNNLIVESRHQALSEDSLVKENQRYAGSGGISTNNREQGFIPAFLDMDTGTVYRSRFPDGRPAPVHMLSGLPEELLETGSQASNQHTVKSSVVSGFVLEDAFYTREQAAQASNTGNRVH